MKRRCPGRGRGPAANRGMPDAEMNAGNDVEIEEGKGVEASRSERVPDPLTPEPNQQVQTCEFWFIPVAAFMALPDDQPLPPQQELRDRGLLVKRSISMKDVVNGSVATDTAAVSHRWDTPSHPDPECFKIKKLKSVLGEMPLIKFLWMDFICALSGLTAVGHLKKKPNSGTLWSTSFPTCTWVQPCWFCTRGSTVSISGHALRRGYRRRHPRRMD